MKRLFTILAALALVIFCATLLPTEAQAASESDLTFTLNADGESYSVSDCYSLASGSLTIPFAYNGKPVTSIGSFAFRDCSSLTSITIPASVTSIGYRAFENCTSLTSVTIPDGVTSIGGFAFYMCCNLTSVSIPDSVTGIGWYTFFCCNSLTSVTIPDSVTSIGDEAFSCCDSLTSVVYCGTEEQWNQISIGSYNDPLTNATLSYHNWIGENCAICSICGEFKEDSHVWVDATCTEHRFCFLCGIVDYETVGHDVENGICTRCQRYGLCGENITWTLSDEGTLTISGSGAMYDYGKRDALGCIYALSVPWSVCSNDIKAVVIESGVTHIGCATFWRNSSLESVTIPETVKEIGAHAFYQCTNLQEVHITDVAAWCGIFFEAGLQEVWDYFFMDVVASNPLSLAERFYVNGELVTDVVIPEGVTKIANNCFESCEFLTSVTIGNGVTSIGYGAFLSCDSLTNVTIVDSVTSIGDYAFYNCDSLTSVTIPDSVTSIGYGAFLSCDSLTNVTYCGTEQQWKQINIEDSNTSLTSAQRSYHNWVGEATCTTQRVCSLCNEGEYGHAWVAATCTTCKTCSACGITEGTALGHTWLAATCLKPKHCTVCGVTEGTISDHTYSGDSDAFCNVCNHQRILSAPSLKFYGTPGLSFQEYIGIQVLLINQSVADYDEIYVVAVQQTPNGEVTTTTEGILYANNYTIFEQQIVSWSMTEQVTMTLYGKKNGVVYQGVTITTSVKKLAEEKLLTYSTQGNEKVCRALVDMLNYGAAVQSYYNYNATNLPNTDIEKYLSYGSTHTPELSATNSTAGTGTVTVYGDNISLQDKVEFNLMFNNADMEGREVKATVGGEAVDVSYNTEIAPGWTIARVAVATSKMREVYTIALYDANGNAVTQIYNVSVEGYAKNRQGTEKSVVDVAMMRYGDAVRALLP